MTAKEILASLFAKWVQIKTAKWSADPIHIQKRTLKRLVQSATKTQFGKAHRFHEVTNYESFKERVPIRDYDAFRDYIEPVVDGESSIIWPGRPIYFCKSSGTTSGEKYLPIFSDSMNNHISSARNALLSYIHETGNTQIVNGKMIFLQGSPELSATNGVPTGRLSGIVAHHIPSYLQKNRLPSFRTNCIADWEQKVDAIVLETMGENMTVIGGIPPWLQMYFEKLIEVTGKPTVSDLFPNLKLIIVGGVNFEPYRQRFTELLGKSLDYLEMYPASEGFFAYQNQQKEKDLLLLLNENIFYEFVPAEEVLTNTDNRVTIEHVELNKNYAIILNSNAGFWGYLIGDTVRFTSLNPYKLVVTGRISQFISAFGEHVIAEEVEAAIHKITSEMDVRVTDFTVAPKVETNVGELPHHEWFIEFLEPPKDTLTFAEELDAIVRGKNSYYNDLIAGRVLQKLKIRTVTKGGFLTLMRRNGKLGGQNKMVHLSNDRTIADLLNTYDLLE